VKIFNKRLNKRRGFHYDYSKGDDYSTRVIMPPCEGWLEKKLNPQEMDYLWRCVDNRKESTKDTLAGNIHDSNSLVDKGDWFFLNTLLPLSDQYIESFGTELTENIPINQRHPFILNKWWVNYQKQHEFNPLHQHSGVFSFVIWMKIPYDHEEQNKNNVANFQSKGIFEFCYSNILGKVYSFPYELDKSYEGRIVFFPSTLKHIVYPFYNCDEDRISISGNIVLNTAKRL